MSDSAAYLLRGGLLLTMDSSGTAPQGVPGDLLVQDGRIKALGAVPEAVLPPGVRVLPVDGCAVMPGLV